MEDSYRSPTNIMESNLLLYEIKDSSRFSRVHFYVDDDSQAISRFLRFIKDSRRYFQEVS